MCVYALGTKDTLCLTIFVILRTLQSEKGDLFTMYQIYLPVLKYLYILSKYCQMSQ